MMTDWLQLLRNLPVDQEQLSPFLSKENSFYDFINNAYDNLPEEQRRLVERNLTTRKGTKFLDLLQNHHKPAVRAWAVGIANLLPAELRIPRLLTALADKDDGIKISASTELGRLRSGEVVNLLIDGLVNETWLPARIAQALVAIGELALPNLVVLTKNPEEKVRLYAVEILEQFSDPIAFSAIGELLKNDPSIRIRKKAVSALTSFSDVQVGRILEDALCVESDSAVKPQIIKALGRLQVNSSCDVLRQQLLSKDEKISLAAKEALNIICNKGD